MSEKIDEFIIRHPLTAAKRKALEALIDQNAHQSPAPVTYQWESPHVLIMTTHPVRWEIVFHARKIELFAEAPFWARMLLTKKKREALIGLLEDAIEELGFLEAKPASPPISKAKPAKKARGSSRK